ncbi:hypothetical protein [Streptomyces sparsogenes]|uniref:hypothetical protein n=1 Tax=Streptomyces sparsogenes TaxID=67365 RepID=UPI003F4CC947
MWAGLNLQEDDLPQTRAGNFYPLELVRAVTLTWLFSGQRSDEIARLRVGCIRWQHDGTTIAGDSKQVLARDAVCLLDVPTHKTGTAFTKPVDPILGQALDACQAIRHHQAVDRLREGLMAATHATADGSVLGRGLRAGGAVASGGGHRGGRAGHAGAGGGGGAAWASPSSSNCAKTTSRTRRTASGSGSARTGGA